MQNILYIIYGLCQGLDTVGNCILPKILDFALALSGKPCKYSIQVGRSS
jgi:hypothetical protein